MLLYNGPDSCSTSFFNLILSHRAKRTESCLKAIAHLRRLSDGTLRQRGVFSEEGLVAMPSNLSFLEASTLAYAGLTSWNALHGSADHPLVPGDGKLTTRSHTVQRIQSAKTGIARINLGVD
jgi:hypothetical protein